MNTWTLFWTKPRSTFWRQKLESRWVAFYWKATTLLWFKVYKINNARISLWLCELSVEAGLMLWNYGTVTSCSSISLFLFRFEKSRTLSNKLSKYDVLLFGTFSWFNCIFGRYNFFCNVTHAFFFSSSGCAFTRCSYCLRNSCRCGFIG